MKLEFSNHKMTIIGASGTGKSTLAKAIGEKMRLPHFDSDHYFHFPTDPPFQKQRSPEDRLSLLMADLNQHSSWVLSGGAGVWKPAPTIAFTFVVFLYLPPLIRLERLRQRERQLYGSRVLKGGDMESDHQDFMQWSEKYDSGAAGDTNSLPSHKAFLNNLTCPVVRFESPMTTEKQVADILHKFAILDLGRSTH